MENFVFDLPTRVVFGAGAMQDVGAEVAACGTRAMLVTGSTFARKSGLIDRLLRSLAEVGIEVEVYDGIEQNPETDAINLAGETARRSQSQFVIGLGGGSTLDAAKAVAVAARTDRSIWDFVQISAQASTPEITDALPLVQIPLIASTGSETNSAAVIFDRRTRIKAPLVSRHLYARVAIVDPALTFSVPARYTAVGGMNIVSQMLESYLTSDEFAATDRVTEGLVRVVMDSLARAMRNGDDLDARNNLSWAATLASTVAHAGRGGFAPLRAMAYPLTARFPIEHGQALSALWPSYMRYALANRARLPQIGRFKRFALLGRQLFGVHETDDEVAAETTSYRFTNWLRGTEMPTNLRGWEIDERALRDMATQVVAVSGHGRLLPNGMTVDDVEHIYEGALRAL